MLQWVCRAVITLTAFILLTAMGTTGGFEKAPRVEKNFAVIITDASGSKIAGEKFSAEGRIYFSGYLGMAQVMMPFDRVRELTVGEFQDRKAKVLVKLIDGTQASFEIDSKTRCYGEANFGSFMLTISEIKTIVFK
ncbi:MAG TPA: hypothetical protein VLX29_00145 [Nitrospirota bacterium]|nr:hypothetical protein [Nitrospirota bacterium]